MSAFVIGLAVVAILFVLFLKFRPQTEKTYDKSKYEGKETKEYTITAKKLSDLVENRDDATHERIPTGMEMNYSGVCLTHFTSCSFGEDSQIRFKEWFGWKRFR